MRGRIEGTAGGRRQSTPLVLRLTLYFALASGLVLLGLGWLIARSIEAHFVDLDRDTLLSKIHLVHGVAEQHSPVPLAERLGHVLPASFSGHHDLYARVIGPDGGTLFDPPGVSFPADLVYQEHGDESLVTWQEGPHHYRGMAVVLPVGSEGQSLRIAVAIDTAHHDQFMAEFRATLTGYVLVAALLSGVFGWLAARRGLRPLRAMGSRAAVVTASRLDQRMPVESVPAEMADLARELNDMLARLEDAFRRLSEFSSDLAHELRTPISNLLTQTEVALSRPREAENYRDILASNAEELQRLARMVADMLFLAKAENGLVLPSREPVDLAAEVRALFDYYEALAEERGVALQCTGSGAISGDRLMVRRAINNLLSNALRHTRHGEAIVASVRPAGGAVELAVENPGEPIPADRLPHLFDRFFRADRSRQHGDAEGAGLGLAITRAIVAAHGGTVAAASADGCNRFTLRFPASGAAAVSAPAGAPT
jgi:two-component system heavy metal sensor histidine kinase CusS